MEQLNKLGIETTEDKLLVFHIDNRWNLDDLQRLLHMVEKLNVYFHYKASYRSRTIKKSNRLFVTILEPVEDVPIKSIKYGSPGVIELIFSAGVIGAVVALIKHYIPNQKKWLDAKKVKAEVIRIEIENLKEMGFTESEIRGFFYPKLEEIANGIQWVSQQGKLGKVKEVEEKELDDENQQGFQTDF